MSSSVSVYGSDDSFLLLEESEQAAKEAAKSWIRAALREAFLQALKNIWICSSNDDGAAVAQIEVTQEGYQQCLSFVEDVVNAWKMKLQQAQHERVSEWVEEVFSMGKSTLWNSQAIEFQQLNQSPTLEREEPATTLPGGTDSQETTSTSITTSTTSRNTETLIPYCKLRRLERKTHLEEKLPENPLPIFQDMGRRGESYWPLDWKLIEVAAKREKQQKRNSSKLATTEQGDNPSMPPPAKRRKVEGPETGRPPADLASMTTSSNSLSKEEKDRLLEQFIHPSSSDHPPAQRLALFGALQKVSQINYSNRYRDDWTERKNRLERNASTAERLFPNKIESNDSVRSYRSKVLKTRHRQDDNIYCFDLDMGWSLLEVPAGGGEQKRLCAFSSVEIRLDDHDDLSK
eukprot:scaffold1525_cov142-Cylindrotheca_fusiformis.AAC.27